MAPQNKKGSGKSKTNTPATGSPAAETPPAVLWYTPGDRGSSERKQLTLQQYLRGDDLNLKPSEIQMSPAQKGLEDIKKKNPRAYVELVDALQVIYEP